MIVQKRIFMKYHPLSFLFFLIVFFSACDNTGPQKHDSSLKVEKLAESVVSWNGDTLSDYISGQPQVTILKITIPPKYKLEWHKHPVINAGVMLKGELTVISEKKDTLRLVEGQSLIELVNTFHYGINQGDDPAQILVFYAGNQNVPITVMKEK